MTYPMLPAVQDKDKRSHQKNF